MLSSKSCTSFITLQMARVCRLLALLAALASAKKDYIGPTSERQLECTPEAGGTVTENCVDCMILLSTARAR